MKRSTVKTLVQNLVLGALFLALALVLPFLTGQIPEIGSMLCPMHLPVLLAGFICGAPIAAAVGFIAPLLLSLIHIFVKGTKLELPVLVAAFYGLRRGEVCGLKWDAIDFERGTITIRHTVTSLQVDGKTKMYAQDSAKTNSSISTLPLVGSFAEYFKEVKAAQEVNKKVCGLSLIHI